MPRGSSDQLESNGVSEVLENGPALARRQRDDHVQALASRRLCIGSEIHTGEQLPDRPRCLHHLCPAHSPARVEIQSEAIRFIDVTDTTSPWVNLQDAHLREGDQTPLVFDEEVLATSLFLLDQDRLEMARQPVPRMPLEEARLPFALWAAQQAERPFHDMRQDPIGDASIEFCEISLCQALLGIEEAIGMGEPHP